MEHLSAAIFWLLSAIFIISAILVVALPSVFYSAVALGSALTVMAGLFIFFGADFLSVAQILVYVGGVMIIMLFVIMLTPQERDHLEKKTFFQWLRGIVLALGIGAALVKGFEVFKGQTVGAHAMA